MIESDGQLATWRLRSDWLTVREQSAESIEPHRLDFLEYEGQVSRNRGNVKQVDRGTFTVDAWSADRIIGTLENLYGESRISLVRTGDSIQWTLARTA
jgi:hypothetical protein